MENMTPEQALNILSQATENVPGAGRKAHLQIMQALEVIQQLINASKVKEAPKAESKDSSPKEEPKT